ncbi:MAG: RAMP superfamily CRISPR-associated protein [Candidatus Hermodarchaeota archaeon]
MKDSKNKSLSNNGGKPKKSQKILKVRAYGHIVKTLNGSMSKSNLSYLLRLAPITYTYQGYQGKGENRKLVTKEETSEIYAIKGLKGAVRHSSMKVAFENNYEVCHTSDKLEDKNYNSLLPAGFHQLGSCQPNSECLVHQVYGSKNNRSLITVHVLPITSIGEKTAKINQQVQNVHIATENRVCLSFDKKSIQDFRERYFSGAFGFEIEVTKLNLLQLGFILHSVAYLHQLGRGATAGYGQVEIQNVTLVERFVKKKPVVTEDGYIFEDVTTENILKQEFMDAWEAFDVFITNGSGNNHTHCNQEA